MIDPGGQNGARSARHKSQQTLLVDDALERLILASCLLRPHFLFDVDLTEADFWSEAHRVLWRAIVKVYADEGTVDSVRLTSYLLDHGELVRAGGQDAIVDLTENYIPTQPLPTARLRRLRIQRRMRQLALLLADQIEDQVAREKIGSELEQLRRTLEETSDTRANAPAHRLDPHWRTVGERGALQTAPAPRQWLLLRRDDESNGMANPVGVLALGKTGMLVAQGGTGKTIALIQLAIAVATGGRWLDYFFVGRAGRVLLALAEEDGEELDRRIHDLASAMRLTDLQRHQVEQNVVALGLSGEVTSLVAQDGKDTQETDVLAYFRRRLSEGPWSLIVLDTLTRFAGGDTEKDSAQATRFIQAVESLCRAPGSPTVLVAHHTNKISRVEGAATSAANSRGSSALTDGARWVANLESLGDDGAKLTITKSNYAPAGAPVMLTRDGSGMLRAESPEAARVKQQERQAELERDRWDGNRARILKALAQHTGLRSRGEVASHAGGRKQEVLQVLRDLIEGGEVSLVGGVYRASERGSND